MNVVLSGVSRIALVPAVTLSFMGVGDPVRMMNFNPVTGAGVSVSSSLVYSSGMSQSCSLTIPSMKSSVWSESAVNNDMCDEYNFSFKERPVVMHIASTERFSIIVSDDDFLI